MFTMARIKATRGKGKEFFLNHLSCNDYYSEKERIAGMRHGSLAEDFGLSGQVVDAAVFSLFQQNVNPETHRKLTQRTVNGGISFYDFQCSAQKSVSIMSLFDERLVEAHQKAVALAMTELEKFAAVRIRNGENVNTQNHELTGKIIYAAFHHDTSRALDPQLHTHNVVCNVTKDAEGRYKALENSEMCRAIRYCGRVYQNALACECRKLGYAITETVDFRGNVKGFEIQGVSPELQERFSKRTRDIDEGISHQEHDLGRTLTAAEKHEISLATRERKMAESDAASVRKKQRLQMSPEEQIELEKLVRIAKRSSPVKEQHIADQVIAEVLPEFFERVSVLKEYQILAEILVRNTGNFSLAEVKKSLERHQSIQHLPGGYVTPFAVMEAEQYALDAVERERNLYEPLNADFLPFPEQHHREAQRKVIQGILQSRDRFTLLRGVAGSGKTSVLKELARALEVKPLVLAPTNSAADVLKSEGFANSQTVAGFLLNPPDFSGLLIVDEAGLNSLRDGVKLLRLAEQKKFRILFVGDSRQHSPVDRGDFFHLLEEHSSIAGFELKEIHRQQIAEYRKGVLECANGDFQSAFGRFDRAGYLHENRSDYLKQAAEKFIQLRKTGQVIAVAPTHKECDALTAEIRAKLPPAKVVATKEVFRSEQLTRAKLRNPKTWYPGQTILFVRRMKGIAEAGTAETVIHVDGKKLLLSNGKMISIPHAADFIASGEMRSIELREGDVIQFQVNLREQKIYNGNLARITGSPGVVELLNSNMEPVENGLRRLPENFAGFDYGWVTTSHKSQGRTAQHVVVAAQKLDRRAFYVACSRGRQSLDLYCLDKNFLKKQLIRDPAERNNVADILPSLPTKEYLKSSENEVAAWLKSYQTARTEYERELAEFHQQRNRLYAQLNPLKREYEVLRWKTEDLSREIHDFKAYQNLPLLERLKRKILGKIPPDPKRHDPDLTRMRELEPICNELAKEIRSLKKPQFTMPERRPLPWGKRLAAWIRQIFRPRKSQLTESDKRLIECAKSPSEDTLWDWFLARDERPFGTIDYVFQKVAEKLRNPALRFEPQSEEQYKCFRRAEKDFSNYAETVRASREKTMEEWEQRMEKQRQAQEYLRQKQQEEENRHVAEKRRLDEARKQKELDALNAERRKNPMTKDHQRYLENLFAQGKIDSVPQELSVSEAVQMIENALADDPVTPRQKELILQRISEGLLPYMSEADVDSLTQKEFPVLMKQARKERELIRADRQKMRSPEKEKSRGMDR